MMGELTQRYINKQRDLTNLSTHPDFPRIIKIDICNSCNYACVFCPQSKQIEKFGNINHELCVKIIEDAYRAGAREICLSSTGEPLLNRNLENYIGLSKKLGYEYIFFNTNGLLLDEKRSRAVLAEGVDSVKFSINAGHAKYSLIHGAGNYEKVIENLKTFDRVRKEMQSSCKLYVSYVVTRYSSDEIEEVKSDVAACVDDIMIMNANNRGGVADEVDGILFSGNDDYSYQYPCSQIFNNVYITSEGYMVACCQDFDNNMVIADLNEMTVDKAWNCEAFTEFRERFLKRDYDGLLCDNCLNNTHNAIEPLNSQYKRYKKSQKRMDNLMDRIDRLGEQDKH